jgi:hypothetical protein
MDFEVASNGLKRIKSFNGNPFSTSNPPSLVSIYPTIEQIN